MALTDYEDFIHHVMKGYEKMQEGLNMPLSNLISEQEYIKRTRQNFQWHKTKAEEFAKNRFGLAWQSVLDDIKNFRTQ